jgi:dipeptidyl aminopeptidase/acylaminoacyl peptidase
MLYQRVGHPEADRELLESRSPLNHIDRIQSPLMIAQGKNDPRVKREESLQIVEALQKAGKTVEYLEFADEGHGFARPENRQVFYARAEKFLAEHLGGKYPGISLSRI